MSLIDEFGSRNEIERDGKLQGHKDRKWTVPYRGPKTTDEPKAIKQEELFKCFIFTPFLGVSR